MRFVEFNRNKTDVFCNGQKTGAILRLHDGQWQYWHKGSRLNGGPILDTLDAVKQNLEEYKFGG